MPERLFPTLSDAARVWIYAADRPLDGPEQAAVRDALAGFLARWTSHRRPVTGAADVWHDRFVVIAAEIPGGDLSGCGIDKSVHALEAVAQAHGFAWVSNLSVCFRDADGAVQCLPRPAFRERVRAGDVTTATTVYDLSVGTLDALREGAFERPAGAGWHGRVFRIPEPA